MNPNFEVSYEFPELIFDEDVREWERVQELQAIADKQQALVDLAYQQQAARTADQLYGMRQWMRVEVAKARQQMTPEQYAKLARLYDGYGKSSDLGTLQALRLEVQDELQRATGSLTYDSAYDSAGWTGLAERE